MGSSSAQRSGYGYGGVATGLRQAVAKSEGARERWLGFFVASLWPPATLYRGKVGVQPALPLPPSP
jgi:hypothetical protein